ncbi:MAG: metal ABC transporter substrate-binding protein [Chloroflexota bacterium]
MSITLKNAFLAAIIIGLLSNGCTSASQKTAKDGPIRVLVVETFLADITQNITGDRLQVESLIPIGIDPHAYEPTPQDVSRIADSQLLIANGAGFESWLSKTLENAGGQHVLLEASSGLVSRKTSSGELIDPDHSGDPHFWLDPNYVIKYSENIRDSLIKADPAGAETYTKNATAYIQKLRILDGWIREQTSSIPEKNRLLVTNHESLGYFADRYGFTIIGTVIPSTSTEASPSARQMVDLIDRIKKSGAKAIFLETGANPQMAEQIAKETGVKIVTDMYTHSITDASGAAPTYIEMMKHNVLLLQALK